jgi:hypothetical protein
MQTSGRRATAARLLGSSTTGLGERISRRLHDQVYVFSPTRRERLQ